MSRFSENTVFRGTNIPRTKTTKTMKLTAPLQTQVRGTVHRELQLTSSASELVSSYSRSRFTASTKRSNLRIKIRCFNVVLGYVGSYTSGSGDSLALGAIPVKKVTFRFF